MPIFTAIGAALGGGALLGLGATAVAAGSAASIYQGSRANTLNTRAADQERKARAVEQKRASVRAARERAKLLAASRVRRAQTVNIGAQTGATGSSGLYGATSAIASQTGSAVSFLDTDLALQAQRNSYLDQATIFGSAANRALTRAGAASTIADVGLKAFTIFDNPKGP